MRNRVLLVALILVTTGMGAQAAPFTIFKDGRATTTIVIRQIPGEAAREVVKAVEIFREDIAEGFDVGIPFGESYGGPNRIELVVEDRPLETEDATVIDFPADNVMRITGGKTGVMRALFWLLEEYAGVRYLGQGGEKPIHFPDRAELVIPRETIRRNAAYPFGRLTGRSRYYIDRPPTCRYFWLWEVRLGAKAPLRYNHALTASPQPPRRWLHCRHEIAFPLRKYRDGDEKPSEEMFPILHGKRYLPYLHLSGRHAPHDWQPCFTSQAAVDEAAANLIAHLEKHPYAKSLPLGVNDCGGHCECKRCVELDKTNGERNSMGYPERSESYYRWINQVVGRAAKRFPRVKFGVIAYREVLDPPSAKLHPNVIPVLCFDFNANIDPEVEKARKKLIEDWAAKAENIGFWAYDPGFYVFTLPRVYYREQQRMVQFIRDHKGAMGYSSGGYYFTANEGPKAYLHFKLTENPDLDLEATIMDWCRACVGEQAAPHLREYYAFWERFWREKASKTSWWESRRNVYLTRKLFGSYMYGLEPGDMAKCRRIMEQVVKLAELHGTEDQKIRAALQMRCFEWHEAAAKACAAESVAPDASIPSADAAAALVRGIPEALRSFGRWKTIPAKTRNWYASGLILRGVDAGVVADSLMSVSDFVGEPAVKAELEKLVKAQTVTPDIRFLAKLMLKGAEADAAGNLLEDASLERVAEHGWATTHPVHGKISRAKGVAASGDHALKCEIQHNNYTIEKLIPNTTPGASFYFAARIFVPKGPMANLEGRLNIWGNPATDGRNRTWPSTIPDLRLTAGKWNYVSAMVPAHPEANTVWLRMRFKTFETGAVAYIDDLQLYELPRK